MPEYKPPPTFLTPDQLASLDKEYPKGLIESTMVLCVKHRTGWCALKPGSSPDPEAWSDETACGMHVILRQGLRVMIPTCNECKAALKPK